MSFVPGSIAGDIILGIDGFTQPLLQAEHLAEVFPDLMETSLAQPLRELGAIAEQIGGSIAQPFTQISSSASESAGAVQDSTDQMQDSMGRFASGAHDAGDASEEMGHSILKSMIEAHAIMELFPEWVATFWADPMLGIIDLAKETGHALFEAFNSVADDALDMELASEKLGVSIEFFSKWAGVAKTVNIDAEQLSNGMYMLNRVIGEEMLNPTKALTQAFGELGISQQWLNAHAGDTEGMFTRIKDGLDAMTDVQERSTIAQEVAGRGARDLIPLLLMHKDAVDSLMKTQEQLGDVTDANEGKMGRTIKVLKTEFDEAWEGVEKALVLPALEYLAAHGQEITTELIKGANWLRDEINKLWSTIESIDWKKVKDEASDFLQLAIAEFHDLEKSAKSFWGTLVGDAKEFQKVAEALQPVADLMAWITKQQAQEFTQVGTDTGTGFHGASTPWAPPNVAQNVDPKTHLSPSGIYQPQTGEHSLYDTAHFSSESDRINYLSAHNRRQYDPTDPDNMPLKPGQTTNQYHIVVTLPPNSSAADAGHAVAKAITDSQKKSQAEAKAAQVAAATGAH